MDPQTERRRSAREERSVPKIGVLYYPFNDPSSSASTDWVPHFVDLLNEGRDGFLALSDSTLAAGTPIGLEVYSPKDKKWSPFRGQVAWCAPLTHKESYFHLGLDLHPVDQGWLMLNFRAEGIGPHPLPADYDFFIRTKLLRAIPRKAVCPVLNSIFRLAVPAGERLINQGDPGDAFFIIQQGACVVHLEKGGELVFITRLREGDVVGEMAVLTGEPRSARVTAETDLVVWGLTKERFNALSTEYPDLREFLTELVAYRFASSRITADRIYRQVPGHRHHRSGRIQHCL